MNEQKFIEEMVLIMNERKFTEETLHTMLYFLKIVRTKKLAILQTNISKMT